MSISTCARSAWAWCATSLLAVAWVPTALAQEKGPKAAAESGVVPAAGEKKPDRVAAKAFLSVDRLPAGGQCRIVMVLTIEDDWHIKPNPVKLAGFIPTTFTIKSKQGTVLQKVQYPAGTPLDPAAKEPYLIYEKQVAVYGVLNIPKEAAGQVEELDLEVKYQACRGEDHCEFPKTLKLNGKLEVAPPGEPVADINAKYFFSREVTDSRLERPMDPRPRPYAESAFVKTKIIATVGPACGDERRLLELATAGVDVFRLNFAHGEHGWLAGIVAAVRRVSEQLSRPIGILGDLSGPKIRLGELPTDGLLLTEGATVRFVRGDAPATTLDDLTCTYDRLIDDVRPDDRILLADGTVSLRVLETAADGGSVACGVEQPGLVRSRQGVNLPGVALSTPALTAKDRVDLAWAVANGLDFVGLSFVRKADDVRLLRAAIDALQPASPPQIVAKIEKHEAVVDLEAIVDETDAVMVARGDLGVEVDVYRVPALQKRIIRLCNQRRVPVITATQMLDSMQRSELPTRAEASDVANAVLDGTDALMLSGETAVGVNPARCVQMMSRIACEAEKLLPSALPAFSEGNARNRALPVTEAVTLAAGAAAAHLKADLIVVATHTGRTAMSVSKQRCTVPILALTDDPVTARRQCLVWGVRPMTTQAVSLPPDELLKFVVTWGKEQGLLREGARLVLVGSTDWSDRGHDMMLVHAVR